MGNPCKVKRKITDKDMFDTVQELLEANSKVVQKNPSHCLVGKLFCESCKQRMAHSYRGRPKYYCKTRYYESDNTGCVTSVLDETLEQIVIDEFNHIQENRIDAQKIFQEQNEKLKELRREEVIGLEVFSFEGNGMRLKELTRALIEQLVERIVVGEEMIEVEWKFRG